MNGSNHNAPVDMGLLIPLDMETPVCIPLAVARTDRPLQEVSEQFSRSNTELPAGQRQVFREIGEGFGR